MSSSSPSFSFGSAGERRGYELSQVLAFGVVDAAASKHVESCAVFLARVFPLGRALEGIQTIEKSLDRENGRSPRRRLESLHYELGLLGEATLERGADDAKAWLVPRIELRDRFADARVFRFHLVRFFGKSGARVKVLPALAMIVRGVAATEQHCSNDTRSADRAQEREGSLGHGLKRLARDVVLRFVLCSFESHAAPLAQVHAGDGFFPPIVEFDSVYQFNPDVLHVMLSGRNVPYALNRVERKKFDSQVSHDLEPQLLRGAVPLFAQIPDIQVVTNYSSGTGEADLLAYSESANAVLHVQAKAALPPQGARMAERVEGRRSRGAHATRVISIHGTRA